MSKNSDFQKLKILDNAQRQLENLQILKYQLQSQVIGSEKTKLDLILKEKASNLIDCYQELLSLYSRNFNHPNDNQFDDVSYRRSHSRSKVNTKSSKITEKQINKIITNSTLASSVAYIKTNFLKQFQQAGIIYFKEKDYLNQFIQRQGNEKQKQCNGQGRKSQLSIFGQKVRKKYERDESQSSMSSISWSKFYDKPKSIKKIQGKQEIRQSRNQLYLAYIRICMNLVTNLILQNRHTFAMQIFTEIVDFIEKVDDNLNKCNLIQYTFMVWFNIENGSFKTWKDKLQCFRKQKTMKITQRMSVQQAISLSHFIFNSDLFSCEDQQSIVQDYPKHYIEILQKSVNVFLQNSLYEFAFFTLRHLLQSPVSPELKQSYYLQLREMLESGKLKENIQLQNIESVQCFKQIISTLKGLHEETQSTQDFALISSKKDLFIFVIKVQISKISSHSELPSEQKDFLIQKLSIMKNETRQSIIDSMLNQSMSKKIIQDIFSKVQKIIEVTDRHLFIYSHFFLKNLKKNQNQKLQISPLTQKAMNVSSLQHDSSQIKSKIVSPCHSRRYLKVISTSILSDTSSIHYPSTSRKHNVSSSNLTTNSNDYKKISKMVRFCEYGAFLNKRNYNSDGGEIKFIQITYDKIKWSKNPEKINQSSQSYPLKDIKAIFYGKITPNLKKSCNKQLKEQLCFSLILQKRTMDFYCKDYKQVESWVCGLSVILKKQNPQITGYTPGKLRWRKMFANLRQAFIQPLKLYERNQFYFQNAYSLILFQKNGYKLPLCQKIL